ncbi:MAG: Zn-dependent alcohol dehydrogenase, partial [Candidatus Binatia bacterium]
IVGVPKIGTSFSFAVHALYQNKAILGCRYGTARPRRDFAVLADLYLSKRLKIDELITAHYPLDRVAPAFDDLQAGKLARGVFDIS